MTHLPFVSVAVNVPQVSGLFDYHLPAELAEPVQAGSLVVVPFGRQTVQGIVLERKAETTVQQTRPVEALLDPLPVLTPLQLRLASWISEQTLAPLAACLDGMLPPGLSVQADTLYSLNQFPSPTPYGDASRTALEGLSPLQARILARLQERGDLRGRQLEAAFPHVNWKDSAAGLVRRGLVLSRPVLPPPSVRPKIIRTAQIACTIEAVEAALAQIGRAGTPAFERRKKILAFLRQEALPVAVTWVYAASGGSQADLLKLAEAGLIRLGESETWRDPLVEMDTETDTPPALTAGQQRAWEQVRAGLRTAADGVAVQPYLLQGVTGSGKTEIYLHAVAETIRLGRQALVLVPEIALTPQTVRRFLARFPGQVGLIHSRLSPGERFDTWRRARAGLLPVIVGPRSALFAPLPNPGLIVLDECHDDSFFQTENQPYYSAVQAAEEYGRLANAAVLLGSATPSVAQIYHARQENWTILHLPLRILAHKQAVATHLTRMGLSLPEALATEEEAASLSLPDVSVVDMRQELKAGNRSIFSRALQEGVNRVLDAGQQGILFLNRRGTATYVFCRECGKSLSCPRCDLPLTLHNAGENTVLTCHTCSYKRQMPKKCPSCGSAQIRQYGTGTEKVEEEARKFFPGARILRWDAETAREKGSHDLLLAHFKNHQADLLVGTQMLAKGLDLPLVTLVGVILADTGLSFPDYRAGERAFQILTQVSGRAGRSPLGGQVILQTFQPEHYAIRAASRHDMMGFYGEELELRRKMGYPPFSKLARLEFRGSDAAAVEAQARGASQRLLHWIEMDDRAATSLIGPVPCFFGRVGGQYRWQVIVRGPDPVGLLREHLGELAGAYVQVEPPSLL